MKHKWIAVLLVISMLGTMGGCSASGSGGSSSKTKKSSTTESSAAAENSKTEESSKAEESSNTEKNNDESQVLFEDSTVRITYTGIADEDWMGKGLNVTVENLSDKNISVQTKEVSVNGAMDEPYFSCSVAAGKKANDTIYFSTKDDLGTIEMAFQILDGDTYDTIYETEQITFVIDDSITSEKADAEKIYEANGVVISYAGKSEDDIWGTEFNFLEPVDTKLKI